MSTVHLCIPVKDISKRSNGMLYTKTKVCRSFHVLELNIDYCK